MPIEKQPLYPLARDYVPPMSVPYRVKDRNSRGQPETWRTVAADHNLDVDSLVRFNFHTNDPAEVNWYLRRNVGCKIPTMDGYNWTFSASADPGVIYIPTDRYDMDAIEIEGKPTLSPFALEFSGASSPLDKIGKVFDGFQLIDMAMSIAGVAVGEAAMLGIGIAMAPVAAFVAMGGGAESALNQIRNKLILEGLSLGIVLAADGRSAHYISQHGYVKRFPVYDMNYPQYGKQFQGIYNRSLVAGIVHGRQFNTVATLNLFKWIWAQMTDYAKSEYVRAEALSWSERKWEDYYRLCAAIVRQKIVLN
jgi:hypothetical protein